METIDAACGSTHRENIACTSRHPWFRKSKSETETLQRGRLMSTGAVTASSQTSHASSSSSTAASGALHRRTDTTSSSVELFIVARTRWAARRLTTSHALVQRRRCRCSSSTPPCNVCCYRTTATRRLRCPTRKWPAPPVSCVSTWRPYTEARRISDVKRSSSQQLAMRLYCNSVRSTTGESRHSLT